MGLCTRCALHQGVVTVDRQDWPVEMAAEQVTAATVRVYGEAGVVRYMQDPLPHGSGSKTWGPVAASRVRRTAEGSSNMELMALLMR